MVTVTLIGYQGILRIGIRLLTPGCLTDGTLKSDCKSDCRG